MSIKLYGSILNLLVLILFEENKSMYEKVKEENYESNAKHTTGKIGYCGSVS